MNKRNGFGSYITDYAADHGVSASDILALIHSDDTAPKPMFERSTRIMVDRVAYNDAYYSRDYLDFVRSGIISEYSAGQGCSHAINSDCPHYT